MIQLTCTKCQKTLTIDDGFAGGVCRCQYCATIQTVPTAAKHRPASPGAAMPTATKSQRPKALFQTGQAPAGGSNELHALAQAVASSGLSGSGLRASAAPGSGLRGTGGVGSGLKSAGQAAPATSAVADHRNTRLLVLLGASGGAVLVLLGVVVWMALRGAGGAPNGPTNPNAGRPDEPAVERREIGSDKAPVQVSPTPAPIVRTGPAIGPQKPNFMGVPLAGPSVVYVLDRGQGTTDTFFAITGGAMKSITSLGPQIKFQIIFWETDSVVTLPGDALRYATAENVAAARTGLADVFAAGQSRIEASLQKALAQNPAEIVIASGKYGLDVEFAKSVVDLSAKSKVKIHTFCLGTAGSPEVLKAIADETGGQYRLVAGEDLHDLMEWTPG